jgi:alkylated DNA repair dioxygenase AlkB
MRAWTCPRGQVSAGVSAPGLAYVEGWIAAEEERALLAAIDALPWSEELRRRVQHHGYRYAYKGRRVDAADQLGPLPGWAEALARRLVAEGRFATVPDQVIVNEYQPGQGISAHVDCVPCFGPTIASLSLGSGATMELGHKATGERASVWLAPRSLLVLTGEARYAWRHAIPARKSDPGHGPRGRRVSLTFRTVLRSR